MQLLYSLEKDPDLKPTELVNRYQQSVDKSLEMYVFSLHHLIKVTEVALLDAGNRKTKLLPSEEDKNFRPKLFENEALQSLVNNKYLKEYFKKYHTEARIDIDQARMLYVEYAKTRLYQGYLLSNDDRVEAHIEQLLEVYKFCYNQEVYLDQMESDFYWWIDDEGLIIGAVKKTLKALPYENNENFLEPYLPNEEAVDDFGLMILNSVLREYKDLDAFIEPYLQGWELDRIASLDKIMIQMAICELKYCPTIPTKVTLNEFVEISKIYSTEKSKDFINGILDAIMKDMQENGTLHKEGRGLIEE